MLFRSADVQRTFAHLARIVPRNGYVVMNGDDANLAALGPLPWTRVVRVGVGEGNDTRIADFAETADGASFRLFWRGTLWAEVRWTQPGLFNARNAAMAATASAFGRRLDTTTRSNPASRSSRKYRTVSGRIAPSGS